jgi:hypothetical protein
MVRGVHRGQIVLQLELELPASPSNAEKKTTGMPAALSRVERMEERQAAERSLRTKALGGAISARFGSAIGAAVAHPRIVRRPLWNLPLVGWLLPFGKAVRVEVSLDYDEGNAWLSGRGLSGRYDHGALHQLVKLAALDEAKKHGFRSVDVSMKRVIHPGSRDPFFFSPKECRDTLFLYLRG